VTVPGEHRAPSDYLVTQGNFRDRTSGWLRPLTSCRSQADPGGAADSHRRHRPARVAVAMVWLICPVKIRWLPTAWARAASAHAIGAVRVS
jgi:hypothetical protein